MNPITSREAVKAAINEIPELHEVFDATGESIVFRSGGGYEIAFADLRTEADILRWAAHLGRKSWMTLPLLMQFIGISARLAGIDLSSDQDRFHH